MPSLDETSSLLDPFIALLDETAPISVPSQTVLGAITHFISTLDDVQLARFMASFTRSKSLRNTDGVRGEDVRWAVKLGLVGFVMRMENEKKGVYFGSYRRSKEARHWLDGVLHAIRVANTSEGWQIQILVGLLQGVEESQSVDWGYTRIKLEEAAVLALSGDEQMQELELLCAAMPYVDVARLLALDMQPLSDKIAEHIFSSLIDQAQEEPAQMATYTTALGRSYVVLSLGTPSDQQHALRTMALFCQKMEGLGLDYEKRDRIARQADGHESKDYDLHKTAFNAFLLPASSILDILLKRLPADSPQSVSVDLASHILETLFAFSYCFENMEGFEHYQRSLAGCLDIISENGGVTATESLFSYISSAERLPDNRAAFVLVLGDELVHQLGSRSIDLLLPLAERHAHRPEHRPSFEAAHAFFLSLLRVSSETLQSSSPQTDFFDALLPNYLRILTKRANSGDITPDQLKQALPLITSYATQHNPTSISLCLQTLSSLPPSHTTRLIQIRLAPHIASSALPSYLQDLGRMMSSVDAGTQERMELMGEAFQMVSRDLRDGDKGLGVEWWMEWRRRLGQREAVGLVRSRL
ncbi:hypothetical protein IAR50_004734 [Cryptococcus sp. DSM 104548]